MRTLLFTLALAVTAQIQIQAQWQILPSPTTADLRGISAVSPDIAWASGTSGTVLRTTDGGTHWAVCPTPPNADNLDFRGIQAFDERRAIIMSSGKGPLSRLYKTTDACAHWTLLLTNSNPEGFWDAVRFLDPSFGILIGDPVRAQIYAVWTRDAGATWRKFERDETLALPPTATLFAASNSAVAAPTSGSILAIANDGKHSFALEADLEELCRLAEGQTAQPSSCPKEYTWLPALTLPNPLATDTSGLFSVASHSTLDETPVLVAVGGDYRTPEHAGLAVSSQGSDWHPAQTPPHGYRSSVAYDARTKTWITVGPNGTDISTDDGRNWRPLNPNSAEPPDTARNWNALGLPYVVGPHGRIGKLRPAALE